MAQSKPAIQWARRTLSPSSKAASPITIRPSSRPIAVASARRILAAAKIVSPTPPSASIARIRWVAGLDALRLLRGVRVIKARHAIETKPPRNRIKTISRIGTSAPINLPAAKIGVKQAVPTNE